VSNPTLGSLTGFTPTLVSQYPLQHDNIYVTEVVGGDWGTVCLDYTQLQTASDREGEVDMAVLLQTIYAASAGLLPSSLCEDGQQCTTVDELRE
ncbi:hypothetical protein KIPB_013284, partial [Kipferlia bialata]